MNRTDSPFLLSTAAELAGLVRTHCRIAGVSVADLADELGVSAESNAGDIHGSADLLEPADCIAWIAGIAGAKADLTKPELRLIFEKLRRLIPENQTALVGSTRCIRLHAWRATVALHAESAIGAFVKKKSGLDEAEEDEGDDREIAQRIEEARQKKQLVDLD